MPLDSQSIRANESVSIRATTAGMTSVAATRVTPMIGQGGEDRQRQHQHEQRVGPGDA